MMHPLDIGHQSNALPSSKVLDAHLQVLPQCPTRHAIEIVHHYDKSNFAACRRLFEGRQHNISVVLGSEFARSLESNDSWRHVTEFLDHNGSPSFPNDECSIPSVVPEGVTLPAIWVTPELPIS